MAEARRAPHELAAGGQLEALRHGFFGLLHREMKTELDGARRYRLRRLPKSDRTILPEQSSEQKCVFLALGD
jgi:hypothetical protein